MRNEKLVEARKKSGKTQAEVAKELGIAEAAYRRYELGRCIPNVVLANTISKILQTTSEEIWGYKTQHSL